MKRSFLLTFAVLALVAMTLGQSALAGGRARMAATQAADQRAETYPWHGDYYEAGWGVPVALVVPPTASRQTNYHWGVSGYYITPIDHQFSREFPGPLLGGNARFLPTPPWPSDTNQFGVYYVRGPWR